MSTLTRRQRLAEALTAYDVARKRVRALARAIDEAEGVVHVVPELGLTARDDDPETLRALFVAIHGDTPEKQAARRRLAARSTH